MPVTLPVPTVFPDEVFTVHVEPAGAVTLMRVEAFTLAVPLGVPAGGAGDPIRARPLDYVSVNDIVLASASAVARTDCARTELARPDAVTDAPASSKILGQDGA